MNPTELKDLFTLLNTYPERDKIYIVGGFIRDLLLEETVHDVDIDLVFEGDGIALAEWFLKQSGGTIKTFEQFKTAKVSTPKLFPSIYEVDFASARTEIYEQPGKLPKVTFSSITEDLKRRDFTTNACAVPISSARSFIDSPLEERGGFLLDPFSGAADLRDRIVRTLHAKSFIDDPTRLYRAMRYAHRLDAKLEGDTEAQFLEAVKIGALDSISTFRKFTEIRKCCEEQEDSRLLLNLFDRGLIPILSGKICDKLKEVISTNNNTTYNELLKVVFTSSKDEERIELAKALNMSKKSCEKLIGIN